MRKLTTHAQRRKPRLLPAYFELLFWDVDFKKVSWERNRDYVIGRVLSHGGDRALAWLRRRIDNEQLRAWILEHRGRGLSSRQLTYWQLILDLPKAEVGKWLREPALLIWEGRWSGQSAR